MASDAVLTIELPGFPTVRHGKVREVFEVGEDLLLVSTDRISAFDVILPQGIPGKGAVLNQLSAFWFDRLGDVTANHCITIDVDRFPEALQPHRGLLARRSMLCRRTEVVPFECVVRGYLAGSGYKEYQKTGAVCGIELPTGLRLADRLPEPIFTPSTKAEVGHDENIARSVMADSIGEDLTARLESISLQLYRTAAEFARARGIVIADTKFEFGQVDGELLLIDEALTPDSSRFWPVAQIEVGASPPSFDKQFVRDFLETTSWDKRPPAPELPAEIVDGSATRYREILDILTR